MDFSYRNFMILTQVSHKIETAVVTTTRDRFTTTHSRFLPLIVNKTNYSENITKGVLRRRHEATHQAP
jgi:hypothetical protein